MYRSKYHEDSTNVSMVSVSRFAGRPHFGHGTFTKESRSGKGDRPLAGNSMSVGSTTGRSSSGTGTMPHVSQKITGMGAPQYLCREIPQSRIRKLTRGATFSDGFEFRGDGPHGFDIGDPVEITGVHRYSFIHIGFSHGRGVEPLTRRLDHNHYRQTVLCSQIQNPADRGPERP